MVIYLNWFFFGNERMFYGNNKNSIKSRVKITLKHFNNWFSLLLMEWGRQATAKLRYFLKVRTTFSNAITFYN